ncbi:MAG: hypothetical protein ABF811_04115 [Pseudoclavibacter sp.]
MQNLCLASETDGLGTVYLDSITGDPPDVSRALHLPRRTFPLVSVLVEHLDQSP